MKHLFVIGNGFDNILHHLPTSYSDFKEYLLEVYPSTERYCDCIPEVKYSDKTGRIMNKNEIVSYIVQTVDECDGWGNLEKKLGTDLFDRLLNEFCEINFDESDKIIKSTYYINEEVSLDIQSIFVLLKDLFYEWINDKLAHLDYNESFNFRVYPILKEGDAFLTFNYTMLLETVYRISNDKICHIHGKVGDPIELIYFGHGDNRYIEENISYYGADYNLNSLKDSLRKDTKKALSNSIHFFNQMNDLELVHSFGFSFSEVDMIYIHEIARLANVKERKVKWLLNSYYLQEEKKHIIELLECEGFEVEIDNRW